MGMERVICERPSALTIEALKSARTVMVQVESTNEASLRILEKQGYQKTPDLEFLDVKTGVSPFDGGISLPLNARQPRRLFFMGWASGGEGGSWQNRQSTI